RDLSAEKFAGASLSGHLDAGTSGALAASKGQVPNRVPNVSQGDDPMNFKSALFGAAIFALATPGVAATAPTDPQIAHIAYTAGNLDIAAAKQALARSHNKTVRGFAQEMLRDHQAVNAKALALVKKLHVTPE